MPRRESKRARPVVGNPQDSQGMAACLSRYLEWMGVAGYSPRTPDNHRVNLNYFILWCQERSLGRPTEVTRAILERYQRGLYHYRKGNGQPLSFRSQQMLLIPVRAFFKWLAKSNHLLYNPASELELPLAEKRLPRHVLSAGEAEAVLGQANPSTSLGVRDRALLETLYSTEIRRLELVGLKLYDLDFERGTLMIRQGKGKKDRLIPIGDRALLWIEKYLREVRPGLLGENDPGALFLTNLGEPFSPSRLSQIAREYVDAAQIGKRSSCHLFRHTMATLMREGGADIRFIQQMLGHAELSSTQIYTQVSISKLKEVHTATHPARLERKAKGSTLESTGSPEKSPQSEEPFPP